MGGTSEPTTLQHILGRSETKHKKEIVLFQSLVDQWELPAPLLLIIHELEFEIQELVKKEYNVENVSHLDKLLDQLDPGDTVVVTKRFQTDNPTVKKILKKGTKLKVMSKDHDGNITVNTFGDEERWKRNHWILKRNFNNIKEVDKYGSLINAVTKLMNETILKAIFEHYDISKDKTRHLTQIMGLMEIPANTLYKVVHRVGKTMHNSYPLDFLISLFNENKSVDDVVC